MKLFEEFVDALTSRDKPIYSSSFQVIGGHTLPVDNNVTEDLKGVLARSIEDAHIFIISPEAIFNRFKNDMVKPGSDTIGAQDNIAVFYNSNSGEIDPDVAPPFQTCWFQFPETAPLLGITDRDEKRIYYGLFLHEIRPHDYIFCFIMDDPRTPDIRVSRYGHIKQPHPWWDKIALWLQPFGRETTVGIKKTSSRVKIRDRDTGEKRIHKLRNVVMVYPKKMSSFERKNAEDSGVDFSHRFSVRGHWRRIANVGKNRAGEYCVQGFTFVREHEKGPDNIPLTKKVRVVLG